MRILITGGTGLVGSALSQKLTSLGHQVFVLSRDREKAKQHLKSAAEVIEGNLAVAPLENLPMVDTVVHLMGESVVGGRWTDQKKKELYDSRVLSTQNLKESLGKQKVFLVSASAMGFYGDRGDSELTEADSQGHDFLAQLCGEWEKAAQDITDNLAVFRITLVLTAKGGVLKKMLLPFRWGVGGPLGDGEQWMSWIHLEDLVSALVWVIESKKRGLFNASSPRPVTNREFSKSLAKHLHRPLGPAIPSAVLKMIFGEGAQGILASQRVIPRHLQQENFSFQFPDLVSAFKDLLPRN